MSEPSPSCCCKEIIFWTAGGECPCDVLPADFIPPVYYSKVPSEPTTMRVSGKVDDLTDGMIYRIRIWKDSGTPGFVEHEYEVDNPGGNGPDMYVWQVAEELAALVNGDSYDVLITAYAHRDGTVYLQGGADPFLALFDRRTGGGSPTTVTDFIERWPTGSPQTGCMIVGSNGTYSTETSGNVTRVSGFGGFTSWDSTIDTEASSLLPPCTTVPFVSAISGKYVLVVDDKQYVWRAKVGNKTEDTVYGVVFDTDSDPIFTYTVTGADEAGTMAELATEIATALDAALPIGYFATSVDEWVEIRSDAGHRRFGNANNTFAIRSFGHNADLDVWSVSNTVYYGIIMTGWDLVPVTGTQTAQLIDTQLGWEDFTYTSSTGTDEAEAWAYATAFNTWVAGTPSFKGFRGVRACRAYWGQQYTGEVDTEAGVTTALYLDSGASGSNDFYNDCRVVVTGGQDSDTFDILITKVQSASLVDVAGTLSFTGGVLSGTATLTYNYNVGTCTTSTNGQVIDTQNFGNGATTTLTFDKFNPEDVGAEAGANVTLVSVTLVIVANFAEGEAEVSRVDTSFSDSGTVEVDQGVEVTSSVITGTLVIQNDESVPVTLGVGVSSVTEEVPSSQESGSAAISQSLAASMMISTIQDYAVVGPTKLATVSPGFAETPKAGATVRIYRNVGVAFTSSNTAHPADLRGEVRDEGIHEDRHDLELFWAINGNGGSSQLPMGWSDVGVVRKCCGPQDGAVYAMRFVGTDPLTPFTAYDVTASITVDNENTTGDCRGDGPDDTAADVADKWVTEFNSVKTGIPANVRPTATHIGNGRITLEGATYGSNPQSAGAFNLGDAGLTAWFGAQIQAPVNGYEEPGAWWHYDGLLTEIPYIPFVGWEYAGNTDIWHAANIEDATIIGSEYSEGLDCSGDDPPDSACPGRCHDDCLSLDATVTVTGSVTWREQTEDDPCACNDIVTVNFSCTSSVFSGCTSGGPNCSTGSTVVIAVVSSALCPTFGSFQVTRTEVPPVSSYPFLEAEIDYNGDLISATNTLCDGNEDIIVSNVTITFNGSSQWHLGTDEECPDALDKCLPGSNPLP